MFPSVNASLFPCILAYPTLLVNYMKPQKHVVLIDVKAEYAELSKVKVKVKSWCTSQIFESEDLVSTCTCITRRQMMHPKMKISSLDQYTTKEDWFAHLIADVA